MPHAYTVTITNTSDFTHFAGNASAYHGATVLLEADLDLSAMYAPVEGFFGTLDGQGHTVKNLKSIGKDGDSALFNNLAEGVAIKNIVLDRSCVFNTSSNSGDTFIGGLIGTCTAKEGRCAVLNSVTMATVAFSGVFKDKNDGDRTIYMGGIIGQYTTRNYECLVRNAVNYGDVVFNGDGHTIFVGGIVGSYEKGRAGAYLQNVLNYGSIVFAGTAFEEVNAGGVLGSGKSIAAEWCVNAGLIRISEKNSYYAGSLFRYAESV